MYKREVQKFNITSQNRPRSIPAMHASRDGRRSGSCFEAGTPHAPQISPYIAAAPPVRQQFLSLAKLALCAVGHLSFSFRIRISGLRVREAGMLNIMSQPHAVGPCSRFLEFICMSERSVKTCVKSPNAAKMASALSLKPHFAHLLENRSTKPQEFRCESFSVVLPS